PVRDARGQSRRLLRQVQPEAHARSLARPAAEARGAEEEGRAEAGAAAMKAPVAPLALGLALAACASPPPPGEGGISYLVTAARVIGPEALYVEAEAAHRSRFHRLERIALVDP